MPCNGSAAWHLKRRSTVASYTDFELLRDARMEPHGPWAPLLRTFTATAAVRDVGARDPAADEALVLPPTCVPQAANHKKVSWRASLLDVAVVRYNVSGGRWIRRSLAVGSEAVG